MSDETRKTVSDYLKTLEDCRNRGNATEHTYRPALQNFLQSIDPEIIATNEPKRDSPVGAPDYNITRGEVPLGRIETKNIGTDLDEIERGKGEHGEQFLRYIALPNWILTDYVEFRWFVNGKKRLTAHLASIDGKKLKPTPDGTQQVVALVQAFYHEQAFTVGTPKELAERMAALTRVIRIHILATLPLESESGWLHQWIDAFRKVLLPGLTEDEFADMFAQTLAYGLFAARIHAPANAPFTRKSAVWEIPKTNPFLQKLFNEFAGINMPDTFAWAVDNMAELLNHAAMDEILKDFGRGKGKFDPVVHFYETFLTAYDTKMRVLRGVFYTPVPAVSFIVRSIDGLLKSPKHFNRKDGLAHRKTFILDPATGTATFFYYVIDHIAQTFKNQPAAWNQYVEENLLGRILGFELLMAPYAIAHLKLGMKLRDTAYKFAGEKRLGVYLTNSLEHTGQQIGLKFAEFLAGEANEAAAIKDLETLEVVMGNPPYSKSVCESPWIMSLIKDYKKDLNEQKADLNREEWKFLRFAQWRIEKTGQGIVAFVINNTFLDALTHRRMRQCLMEAFNEIYILNLHGSTNKKERAPDGSKDENIFEIKQGVTIAIFVKLPNIKGCRVFHADLWGVREIWEGDKLVGGKYRALWDSDVSNIKSELKPTAPNFFFVPKDHEHETEYLQNYRITEAFPHGNTGIQTKRDELVFDLDEKTLRTKIDLLRDDRVSDDEIRSRFDIKDINEWSLSKARAALLKDENWTSRFRSCLYRPFDFRHLFYSGDFVARDRINTMRHMIHPNIGWIITRQTNPTTEWSEVFVTATLTEKRSLASYVGEARLYPVHLYTEDLHGASRSPNLSPAFLKALAEKLKLPQTQPHGLPEGVTPEDIFHYAYAVFHSPTYRARYNEFLKTDFPRLPLTSDREQFRALAGKGTELVALHLLESPALEVASPGYFGDGNRTIQKWQHTDADQRVWVNANQYFDAVPKNVWEFYIGGYQPCQRWLKERKNRVLSDADMQHYRKIVIALGETIRLMTEIDALIPRWPLE